MTKQPLAAVAALALMAGAAAAQTYPPAPPPAPGVVVPAPPPASLLPPPPPPVHVGTSSRTTVDPGPGGDHREVTTHKEVDENGKTVTEKEIHQEGISGSSETHTKTETNPATGTTHSTTTTKHE
jgi:hypothetical protein